MMKKMIKVCLCSLLLAGCSSAPKTNENDVTLRIKVEDKVNDKVLFDGECTSQGATLADFLKNASDLEVEMEDGQYGKTIMGIKGVVTEDWNKGPWWTYTSEANETCKEQGYCPAASELTIKDGEDFTFTFDSAF